MPGDSSQCNPSIMKPPPSSGEAQLVWCSPSRAFHQVRGGSGNTPLLWASYFNEVTMITALLADARCNTAAANDKGLGCLHQAAVSDSVDALKQLLSGVCEPARPPAGLLAETAGTETVLAGTETKNVWGETPLHLAAAAGHRRCVEVLLSAGANPYAADNWGRTAVDVAREICTPVYHLAAS